MENGSLTFTKGLCCKKIGYLSEALDPCPAGVIIKMLFAAPSFREKPLKTHHYQVQTAWTGNQGEGTKTYKVYLRDHEVSAAGKPAILGSSDPSFRGDPTRYNPEELLVASLSACHMLWYLHLCAVNGIVVTEYRDEAQGQLTENKDGSGSFVEGWAVYAATVRTEEIIPAELDLAEKSRENTLIGLPDRILSASRE